MAVVNNNESAVIIIIIIITTTIFVFQGQSQRESTGLNSAGNK
jgi:hypothetical protein